MNDYCNCCGCELNNKDGWRYYKQGNWYCKTNIRLPEPDSDDSQAYYDIISFLPEDSHAYKLLHDYLEFFNGFYSIRDFFGDKTPKMTYEELINAFFYEYPEVKNELIPVKKDYPCVSSKPVNNYFYGFGSIMHRLDPMHLISYDSKNNRIYALTCLDPQESFLYSVLDAYTFWEDTDLYSVISDLDLPDEADCRMGLLVDATQWLLGIWEPSGNVFGYNAASVDLLKEFDIDMFELNRQEKVAYAYFVNPEFSYNSQNNRNDVYPSNLHMTVKYPSSTHMLVGKNNVISDERRIYGVDYGVNFIDIDSGNDIGQIAIQEVVFRYADDVYAGNYYYEPCTLDCPLADMHVVADCLCRKRSVNKTEYDNFSTAGQQIEICERPGGFMVNGCLTNTGMVIYKCSFIATLK